MINWDVKEDIVKGTLILQLYQGSDMILDIAELDVSDASYSWTVPETLAAGEHYRIRIFQGAIMDISAEFTVE